MRAIGGFDLLDITVHENGVCVVMINHAHPACVMTDELSAEVRRAVAATEADDAVKVVVFRSSDPDFFIAHRDVRAILRYADDPTGTGRFGDATIRKLRQGYSRSEVYPSYREALSRSRKVSAQPPLPLPPVSLASPMYGWTYGRWTTDRDTPTHRHT